MTHQIREPDPAFQRAALKLLTDFYCARAFVICETSVDRRRDARALVRATREHANALGVWLRGTELDQRMTGDLELYDEMEDR